MHTFLCQACLLTYFLTGSVCENTLNAAIKLASSSMRFTVYDKDHNLMVCLIPKNGTEAVGMMLRRAKGAPDWDNANKTWYSYYSKNDNGLQYMYKMPHEKKIKVLSNSNLTSLVVVRNPWGRLISAYENKVRPGKSLPQSEVGNCRAIMSPTECRQENVTWDEFVSKLRHVNVEADINPHFQSQTSLCGLSYFKYTYYARQEYLHDDLQEFIDAFHLPWIPFVQRIGQVTNKDFSIDLGGWKGDVIRSVMCQDIEVLHPIYSNATSEGLHKQLV